MNSVDKQYKELIQHILTKGRVKKDRTGTGTISVFDYTMRFDMKEGFPILTSKKVFFKGVIHELIWFLRGETNIKYLVDRGVHIWDGDAYKRYVKWVETPENQNNNEIVKIPISKEDFIETIKGNDEILKKMGKRYCDEFANKWGELGPVYGQQWRSWKSNRKDTSMESDTYMEFKKIDQITNLINDLKTNPDDRGLIVSAWNVADLKSMALRPCHNFFQCYTYEMTEAERVEEWCHSLGKHISFGEDMTWEKLDELNFPKRKISLKINIRSNDVFLGCPFNISSYGLLLHLLSYEVNMIPDELIVTIGDAHIYLNHIEQAKLQINLPTFKLPTIQISKKSIFDIEYDDIKLLGYKSGPAIKGELSN
jgi:thymidylate synthase